MSDKPTPPNTEENKTDSSITQDFQGESTESSENQEGAPVGESKDSNTPADEKTGETIKTPKSQKDEKTKESNENKGTSKPTQQKTKKQYITLRPIRHNGKHFESGTEVFESDFEDDLERLIKVGAIGELLNKN